MMHLLQKYRCCLAIYLLSQLFISSLQAQSLETIGQLARDGAPNLALELMQQVQPDPEENTPGWIFFEKQRFAILQNWQQWQKLIDRSEQFPANLPPAFLQWAQLQKIDALIKLNQTDLARQNLRQLLWQNENKAGLDIALIRRLIIRSYLLDDNLDDVDLAMRYYENDYGNKGWQWQKLRARVLLRKNQVNAALALLDFVAGDVAELKQRELLDHEALAMRLLAQLQSVQRTPKSILGDVRALIDDEALAHRHKLRYLVVGAEAAKGFGGRLTRVRLLEQAMQLPILHQQNDKLFALSGEDLWQAYEDYAITEGNQQQLLIGQDQRWLTAAEQWLEKRPEKARAFYSIVMHQGTDVDKQEQAYQKFAGLLNSKSSGKDIMRNLFARNAYYPSPENIPTLIKYQLVDEAIARQDIKRASELMLTLNEAPEQAQKFNWSLRRARVLILGSKVEEGKQALESLFNDKAMQVVNTGKSDITPEQPYANVDAYLQVIFDLQKVDAHQGAVKLLTQLLQKPLPGDDGKKLRREILFWLADSHKAERNKQRNPVLAAAFYLRSATLLDGLGNDPWGQTARFQAAEVLAQEGIVEDARRIYKALLNVTQEPARRAMIEYRLQELWLTKKSAS